MWERSEVDPPINIETEVVGFFFYDEEESSEEDSLSLKYRLDLASLMSDHTILGRLIRLPRPTLQHMRPIRPLRPIDQKHVRNS